MKHRAVLNPQGIHAFFLKLCKLASKYYVVELLQSFAWDCYYDPAENNKEKHDIEVNTTEYQVVNLLAWLCNFCQGFLLKDKCWKGETYTFQKWSFSQGLWGRFVIFEVYNMRNSYDLKACPLGHEMGPK